MELPTLKFGSHHHHQLWTNASHSSSVVAELRTRHLAWLLAAALAHSGVEVGGSWVAAQDAELDRWRRGCAAASTVKCTARRCEACLDPVCEAVRASHVFLSATDRSPFGIRVRILPRY